MPTAPPQDRSGRTYGGQSPEERRADRRRRLLDAALDLFGTKGYRETSVAQLCRAARVAPVKFYEEFASTEQLLVELCDEVWGPLRAEVLRATREAAPSLAAMTRAGLEAYCHGLLGDPRKARVLCVELPGLSAATEATRQEQAAQFATLGVAGFQILTRGQSHPVLDQRQMTILATALQGALQDAIRFWLFAPEPRPSVDDLVDTVMTLHLAVARYLASPPPEAAP